MAEQESQEQVIAGAETVRLRARVAELEARVAQTDEVTSELVSTRGKLRSVVAAAPIVLWAVGNDRIVTMSEGKGLASLGLKPGQIVGLSVDDIYADYPDALEGIRRGLSGEEFAMETDVGGRTWENRYFPERSDAGDVVGLIGISMDVSYRKEAEAERQRMEAQLRHTQKLESLGVLAGGIAHDFNNLLAGSMGHADLALELVDEESRTAEHMREIILSSQRAADLCRQLLAYSGKGQFILRAIDLDQIVEETTHLLELSIAKTSRLDQVLAGGLPAFRGDVAQVEQVVMNLITNASDAAEGNPATIRLRTGVREIDPRRTNYTFAAPDASAGAYVFVSVVDEGVGMPPEVMAQIFDPFFSTKQAGRGLGLAAVLGIVRGHHGVLEVESEPGEGTRVEVFFPVIEEAAESLTPRPTEFDDLHGEGLVLVADDEPAVRTVARTMLETAGFEVIEAENGREAVEVYRERGTEIDAVLLDMTMPVLGGEAAFREMVAIDPDVKVILSTGYTEQDAIADLGLLRPAAFLQKPYRLRHFLEILGQVRGAKS